VCAMAKAKYLCLNGEFRPAADPVLLAGNRAFRFGDALFENIHAWSTEAQLLEKHYNRLINSMTVLGMAVPARLTVPSLSRFITQLLNRNKIFGGAGIRLTVFRETGDNLLPDDQKVSFILESEALEASKYMLNEKGYVIDVCQEYRRSGGVLSGIKATGYLPNVMTALFCEQHALNDAIMLNESGRITGSTRSNIFLVRASSLYTPVLGQGCIPGIMREVIIKLAIDAGLRVNDHSSLTPAVLDDADEVFFTNAVEGIRWTSAYRQRRFYKNTAQILIRKLNDKIFGGLET
jgi:branched-subunit amino acid aminotransferase/4-amino-4-deoxychorismate lyase